MRQGLLLLIELFGDVNIYKNHNIDPFDSIIVREGDTTYVTQRKQETVMGKLSPRTIWHRVYESHCPTGCVL